MKARPVQARFDRNSFNICKVLLALAPIMFMSEPAKAQHNHASGSLNISIVDSDFAVDVVLPAEAVLGFEREPKTTREHKKLRDVKQSLLDSSAWLMPSQAAQCSQTSQGANLFVKDGHAEIIVNVYVHCDQISELQGVEVKLLQMGFSLETLNVLVLIETGSAAMSTLVEGETTVDLMALGQLR